MYKDETQILRQLWRTSYAVHLSACHVVFVLSELRDVRTQKSRLKYEIKFGSCYQLPNK